MVSRIALQDGVDGNEIFDLLDIIGDLLS